MRIILIGIFMSVNYSFAQKTTNPPDEKNVTKTSVNSDSSQVANDKRKAVNAYNEKINQEIALIDQNLKAIQVKWDFIVNSPEDKKVADETGWFEDMTRIKLELQQKRKLLVESLK